MDWESFWNVAHYELWERRLAKVVGRLSHHWQEGCLAAHGVISGRWLPVLRKETPRMDAAVAPVRPPLDLPVLGRAILSRMDADARQALVAAIREEVAEEVRAQAVAEARTELESEYESRRIRLQDQVSKAKEQADADAELRIESAVAKGLEEAKRDLAHDVLDLKEAVGGARQAQDAVTDLLLSLVRQVIGTRKTYLFSRGITELDVFRLNVVLRPHGLRVREDLHGLNHGLNAVLRD